MLASLCGRPCLYTILYWAWWVKWVCTWSETQNLALQVVLLKSASSNYSRQLNWFSTSTKNMLCAILCWLNEQNEQVHSENIFVWLKPDLISFFICDLCYKFWFSRPASNVLSPAFNWAKWVKWVTQGQELNVSLWNRLSLDSVPSNWIKRYNFSLLSPNTLAGGHFVEHTE